MNVSMMNQTYKELIQIARAENIPYSRSNKATLIDRIQHYRSTVDTLYRKTKRDLKGIAKSEGLRGYGNKYIVYRYFTPKPSKSKARHRNRHDDGDILDVDDESHHHTDPGHGGAFDLLFSSILS